jgi:hypothetical protein
MSFASVRPAPPADGGTAAPNALTLTKETLAPLYARERATLMALRSRLR